MEKIINSELPSIYRDKRLSRFLMICEIYKWYLSESNLDINDDFVNQAFSLEENKVLKLILKNKTKFENLISKFLKSNSLKWEQILPLIKAIILFFSVQISLQDLDGPVLISEALEISKDLIYEKKEVAFINAILDKISKFFKELNDYKGNKKESKI
ncbi:transcription antitermination factor NusB [Mycoplasmopsis pulmonis]|nr:transcription antitermination factor NusB [Mycoplasmopsis pulmonis]MDZ7293136.1 hypothetical protein [Mycoplasmopsis pulmonis]VEU67933.1 transcription antitermination protein NusB [Mycoplasmopsis pulmonis]